MTGYAQGEQATLLLMGASGGEFEPAQAPFTAVADVNAALWGDVDNDGHTDLYLCRDGANQLWRQTAPGEWLESAGAFGVTNGEADTVDGALFDADHDGDLDIFCVNRGPNDLLSNNGDGSFRSIGESSGLTGGDRASRQILVTDLDGDRDADIVVLHEERPHEVFLNDRLWSYHPAEGVELLTDGVDATAAVAADQNADGLMEILTIDRQSNLRRWTWDGAGLTAQGDDIVQSIVTDPETARLAIVDIDGDTRLDVLLIQDTNGHAFNEHLELTNDDFGAFVTPVMLTPHAGPELIGIAEDGLPDRPARPQAEPRPSPRSTCQAPRIPASRCAPTRPPSAPGSPRASARSGP